MLDVKIGPARAPGAGPRTTSTSWSPCANTSSSRATFWCCRRLAHSICARARGPVSGSAHSRRPHPAPGPLCGHPERTGQPDGDPRPPALGWWQLTVCAGARWRCPKAWTPQHGRAARSLAAPSGSAPPLAAQGGPRCATAPPHQRRPAPAAPARARRSASGSPSPAPAGPEDCPATPAASTGGACEL